MPRLCSAVVRFSTILLLLAALAVAPGASADELVVDDSAASVQVSGTWAKVTTSPGFLGDEYRYRVAGDGTSSVRWPFPSGAAAGTYEVSARWTSGPNRASNAAYTISSATGSVTVRVDQRKDGGTWLSLGTFAFSASPDQGVKLADPDLIAAAPLPGDPAYAPKAIDFVRQHSPDAFDGHPVRFFTTFQSSVGLTDAFPQGGDASLLPLLNLQLWGLPTSKPAYDA